MIRRTSNPTLSDKVFITERERAGHIADTMTIQGTVNKTILLLLLTSLSGIATWNLAKTGSTIAVPLGVGGGIVGFILAI